MAFSLLTDTDETIFAQDIVLRSYWNEKRWREVISFSMRWPNSDNDDYSSSAKIKLDILTLEHPPVELLPEWDENKPLTMWAQSGDRVWFRTPYGCIHFDFPDGFDLKSTHPALLELATEVLLYPWHNKLNNCGNSNRKLGKNIALSLSCGIDSTAAMLLMPKDTILAYHRRDFDSMLNHHNADHLICKIEEKLSRKVIQVGSNHEKIRAFKGKTVGFTSDYAAGVHLILLADQLDLKGIAFGTPIDNSWLRKGNKYRVFSETSHWKRWITRFRRAGLDLLFPINMVSEAGALRICKNSEFIDDLNSCLRGKEGGGCGNCWKCFNKNGPLGREINPSSKEIITFLATRPLKTAMHALWAIQKMNLEHLVPDLEHLLVDDLEWWEKYYSPGFELIPKYLRQYIRDRCVEELEPMALPYRLEAVDLFPQSN
jgi:hypothetical protein